MKSEEPRIDRAKEAMLRHFTRELKRKEEKTGPRTRIGAELKFPLVNLDGTAAPLEKTIAFWRYLIDRRNWKIIKDPLTGNIAGASKPGPCNDTVASCETGCCKTEFSLAHTADLFAMNRMAEELCKDLRIFSEEEEVSFLGYGIQPITPPGRDLLFKKGRTSVWDDCFATNRHLPPEQGHDMHLFTINAASHVHLDIPEQKIIPAVNAFNGFAPAQIALTAHSPVWQNRLDPEYRCVAEKFWDWWLPEGDRTGIPSRPFRDIRDYIFRIADLKPIYVERNGRPIILKYPTFGEYYAQTKAVGRDSEGRETSLSPGEEDLKLHHSCYWYNARISRYYTVENRVSDQQPPGELLVVAALVLGLAGALEEAAEELSGRNWSDLRRTREAACQKTLRGSAGDINLLSLAGKMVELAERGLKRRGLGEECFLEPLSERLRLRQAPADEAAGLFAKDGLTALLNNRRI